MQKFVPFPICCTWWTMMLYFCSVLKSNISVTYPRHLLSVVFLRLIFPCFKLLLHLLHLLLQILLRFHLHLNYLQRTRLGKEILFITRYKVVPTFESVDEILKCDHSNESYRAVLSCGTVYNAVQGGSNFWVCGWNPKVWPFKWKLLSRTFLWYCLLCWMKSIQMKATAEQGGW